ncbi:MAG: ABC transporter substrate-binding protein [Deltaproteobacteria bacterium]|nr:MAG: ABC transporter substrate-binding protein [Deltaproteobacteria bacterium]
MTADALSVGGVPEHFNLPFEDLTEGGHSLLRWQSMPSGTGSMCRALDDGTLDVAVLLTEGIVRHIHEGSAARMVGTFTETPLRWGVHVAADSPVVHEEDLRALRFGISRSGSGSHLMACIHASSRGWPVPAFEEVGGFEGARAALREGKIDAFLHEKTMALPLVHAGEWRRVAEVSGPWPAFVYAVREGLMQDRAEDVARLIRLADEAAGARASAPDGTVAAIVALHGIPADDARAWLAETRWNSRMELSSGMLDRVTSTLARHGLLDAPLPPSDLLAPGVVLRAQGAAGHA